MGVFKGSVEVDLPEDEREGIVVESMGRPGKG